jgi:hypothetical protein
MTRARLCLAGFCVAMVLVGGDVRASGLDVTLTVKNRENVARTAEPVTTGVPFAQGVLPAVGHLRVLQNGTELPVQVITTARWPDGSVRWALLDFQVDLPASGSAAVTLQTGTPPTPVTGITLNNDEVNLTVDTRAASFVFAKRQLSIRDQRFQVRAGDRLYETVPTDWTIEESGPMKVVVRVDGVWRNDGTPLANDLVRFRARLVFFRGRSDVRAFFTFRNNNSFGWDTGSRTHPRQPDLRLLGASVGPTELLPVGRSYLFGSGVEKTFEVVVPASGAPVLVRTRMAADGTLVNGDAPPRPIAAASPGYYASTRAWGQVAPPVTGLPAERQADFDRFERIQLAKVDRSAVEDPPGIRGTTVWDHLSRDLDSWNDYGDLRWDGNGCGTFSSNHYDWVYGMYLQFMRTENLAFADAARILARHEIDFDIYHTGADGPAYNYQKNWEDRPSHDNPDNCFGPGRPSHTWSQGYALQWLLTGDRRGKDAFDEIQEGVRQYVYESFNGEGYINTTEIRIQGWLVENLVNAWRIDPTATLRTSEYGTKSIPVAIRDVLRGVFDREAAAGRRGYVASNDNQNLSQTLPHVYFLEPAVKAYEEVFASQGSGYAPELLGLIRRMTSWLMSTTYGGDTDRNGAYRPRQIPYWVDARLSRQVDGQLPYLLMVADAAAYLSSVTGEPAWQAYARGAFQDYVRYVGAIGSDSYGDPAVRTPASYASNMFPGTESKIHGWSSRYGQYLLASERPTLPAPVVATQPGNQTVTGGAAAAVTDPTATAHHGAATLRPSK